ncbi:MAG: FtsQ-type POTRA domain-containing protein [Turicibacter sp.]|nr:FtsQ-type POTRA domain-containing protein [Turicibacter sp.]
MKKNKNISTNPEEELVLKERPRTRLRRAFFSFFIILVLLGVAYFASPLSQLGVIHFEGENMISRAELISLIEIDADELFLSINLNQIRIDIEQHPIVREANVSRLWMNRLRVEVVEYTVAICALIEGELYHILDDGVLIHERHGLRANCDELMIQGLTYEEYEEGIPTLFVQQLMKIDPTIISLIQMIEYAPLYGDVHRFSLFMHDGNIAIVSSHSMAERLNLYLELAARTMDSGELGTFHMDIGGISIPFVPH